jgi:ABC-2 type transport system permease protein
MNYRGTWTLYLKEVNRFLNVYIQTLIAPLINTMLLLSIFALIFKNKVTYIEGVPFKQFIIPGLIMMTVIQNAFANTSSTLTFSKVLGIIIDMLIPPLSAMDIAVAISLGGATRGIMAGVVIAIAITILGLFLPDFLIHIHHFGAMLFYLVSAAFLLSLVGMIAGILSDSFDQMSAYTSFVITPLSFLSGTFYSAKNLPLFWQHVNNFNPFFYAIDGFRYALTGHNDYDIGTGMLVITTLNIVLFCVIYIMLKKGYRIKS